MDVLVSALVLIVFMRSESRPVPGERRKHYSVNPQADTCGYSPVP